MGLTLSIETKRGGLKLAVSLPKDFTKEVSIELKLEFPVLSGQIDQWTDHHVILETKQRKYLIPWTAIAYLWIPKKKETA